MSIDLLRISFFIFACKQSFSLQESPRRNIVTAALRRNRFDNGVVGRGMQNHVIAQIERHVSDSFQPRFVHAGRVGEKQQVASADIFSCNIRAL